jgi:predicted DNA-binding protein with PD1-like motif
MTEHPRYSRTPTGFLMVLRQGDNVLTWLERLMIAEAIPSATITGFGFAGRIVFGFFDFEKKDYRPKAFDDLEVANLTGTLAWKDGRPAIHAHGVAGDREFRAFGGHLLELEVGRGSMEIDVEVMPTRLQRSLDPTIGANVLQL